MTVVARRVGALSVALLLSALPVYGQEPSAAAVARALLDAFNRHDPAAMAALVTDDFELYYVGDDGAVTLSTRGPEGLRKEMAGYFQSRPTVRSRMEGEIPGTRFVAFRERIEGGDSSIAVYEIAGGRVRRAWYYPAEP